VFLKNINYLILITKINQVLSYLIIFIVTDHLYKKNRQTKA